jgi:hypothetical protein
MVGYVSNATDDGLTIYVPLQAILSTGLWKCVLSTVYRVLTLC